MQASIIIPCYNEAKRLLPAKIDVLLTDPRIKIIFVNDGSRDDTQILLKKLADTYPERIEIIEFDKNKGKAEAVRKGLICALGREAEVVGFSDADFATPPAEVLRLLDEIERSNTTDIVLGSRVLLLGANIRRSPIRHFVGRIFATVASLAIGTPIYDTQCGAKLFRATDALKAALSKPFSSRWSFDVELLCRLFGRLESTSSTNPTKAIEIPLHEWHDIGDSKLNLLSMAKSFAELLLIWASAERYCRKS